MPKGGRSTRDKILRDADAVVKQLDIAVVALERLYVRADEGSSFINEQVPLLVLGAETLRKALKAFRAGL